MTVDGLVAPSDTDWAGANPVSPAFRDDPCPALKPLREHPPVNRTPLGPWRISRYADIVEVFENAPTRMTLSDGTNPNFDPDDRRDSFREFMLDEDGEVHARLRRHARLGEPRSRGLR
ncbi:MAG: hypothetical protein HY749_10435 [Gammaproteobacteria bacterium]|nr:hypothetical protein [Gammaproteobacteria bacterium]